MSRKILNYRSIFTNMSNNFIQLLNFNTLHRYVFSRTKLICFYFSILPPLPAIE